MAANLHTGQNLSSTLAEITGPTVVLHRPQIPQNTGNISRLCVALNSELIITGKAGFEFDSAAVRRAGLDHWQHLRFTHHQRFADFYRVSKGRRLLAISKGGSASALEFSYEPGDVLIFGNETMGLPPALMSRVDQTLALPMFGPVRSLNLANSVAVVSYAWLHRVYGGALQVDSARYPRTYYRPRQHG